MSHTPGPWTISPYGKNFNHETQQWEHDGSRWHINEPHIDVHPIFDGSGRRDKYPDGIIIGKEESTANALLIAAAPDLLESLAKALEDINWMLNNRQFLNASQFEYIDTAIAKALPKTTGESV